MEQTLLVVNKIVALLEKGIELERVQEHKLVFVLDNVEVARLSFDDKDTRYEEVDLGLVHQHEIKYVLERKMLDGSGLKIHGFAFVETNKDIRNFVNQVLEFVQMDEKKALDFVFYSNEAELDNN